jgi:hypothetical protein
VICKIYYSYYSELKIYICIKVIWENIHSLRGWEANIIFYLVLLVICLMLDYPVLATSLAILLLAHISMIVVSIFGLVLL